jgi:dTDP-4-dehydrorhamnose 3,5-epimerase
MKLVPTRLPGVIIVEPQVFRDDRGFFREVHRDELFRASGLPDRFRQDNHSHSRRDVLRGLHFQLSRPQGKLVTVIRGAVFDVAVDVRVGSPNFGQWVGVTLTEQEPRALWIPPGFAHGFCAVSDVADVLYKCTDVYVPSDEKGIIWCDSSIGIDWPVTKPILSPKDEQYPTLREAQQSASLPLLHA